ncbi:MAG: hypothetical protein U9Q03_02295 [Patescibacteria group bacterium]|nr:hypothetical protein [Patescibacteria group bacterium]
MQLYEWLAILTAVVIPITALLGLKRLLKRRQVTKTAGSSQNEPHTYGPKPYRTSEANPDKVDIPHAIPCAACNRSIEPNDPISLMWHGRRDSMPMKADPDSAAICCLRNDCAPDATSFAGHWDGTKPVWKYGGKTVLQYTFRSGGMMVCGNIGRLGEDD